MAASTSPGRPKSSSWDWVDEDDWESASIRGGSNNASGSHTEKATDASSKISVSQDSGHLSPTQGGQHALQVADRGLVPTISLTTKPVLGKANSTSVSSPCKRKRYSPSKSTPQRAPPKKATTEARSVRSFDFPGPVSQAAASIAGPLSAATSAVPMKSESRLDCSTDDARTVTSDVKRSIKSFLQYQSPACDAEGAARTEGLHAVERSLSSKESLHGQCLSGEPEYLPSSSAEGRTILLESDGSHGLHTLANNCVELPTCVNEVDNIGQDLDVPAIDTDSKDIIREMVSAEVEDDMSEADQEKQYSKEDCGVRPRKSNDSARKFGVSRPSPFVASPLKKPSSPIFRKSRMAVSDRYTVCNPDAGRVQRPGSMYDGESGYWADRTERSDSTETSAGDASCEDKTSKEAENAQEGSISEGTHLLCEPVDAKSRLLGINPSGQEVNAGEIVESEDDQTQTKTGRLAECGKKRPSPKKRCQVSQGKRASKLVVPGKKGWSPVVNIARERQLSPLFKSRKKVKSESPKLPTFSFPSFEGEGGNEGKARTTATSMQDAFDTTNSDAGLSTFFSESVHSPVDESLAWFMGEEVASSPLQHSEESAEVSVPQTGVHEPTMTEASVWSTTHMKSPSIGLENSPTPDYPVSYHGERANTTEHGPFMPGKGSTPGTLDGMAGNQKEPKIVDSSTAAGHAWELPHMQVCADRDSEQACAALASACGVDASSPFAPLQSKMGEESPVSSAECELQHTQLYGNPINENLQSNASYLLAGSNGTSAHPAAPSLAWSLDAEHEKNTEVPFGPHEWAIHASARWQEPLSPSSPSSPLPKNAECATNGDQHGVKKGLIEEAMRLSSPCPDLLSRGAESSLDLVSMQAESLSTLFPRLRETMRCMEDEVMTWRARAQSLEDERKELQAQLRDNQQEVARLREEQSTLIAKVQDRDRQIIAKTDYVTHLMNKAGLLIQERERNALDRSSRETSYLRSELQRTSERVEEIIDLLNEQKNIANLKGIESKIAGEESADARESKGFFKVRKRDEGTAPGVDVPADEGKDGGVVFSTEGADRIKKIERIGEGSNASGGEVKLPSADEESSDHNRHSSCDAELEDTHSECVSRKEVATSGENPITASTSTVGSQAEGAVPCKPMKLPPSAERISAQKDGESKPLADAAGGETSDRAVEKRDAKTVKQSHSRSLSDIGKILLAGALVAAAVAAALSPGLSKEFGSSIATMSKIHPRIANLLQDLAVPTYGLEASVDFVASLWTYSVAEDGELHLAGATEGKDNAHSPIDGAKHLEDSIAYTEPRFSLSDMDSSSMKHRGGADEQRDIDVDLAHRPQSHGGRQIQNQNPLAHHETQESPSWHNYGHDRNQFGSGPRHDGYRSSLDRGDRRGMHTPEQKILKRREAQRTIFDPLDGLQSPEYPGRHREIKEELSGDSQVEATEIVIPRQSIEQKGGVAQADGNVYSVYYFQDEDSLYDDADYSRLKGDSFGSGIHKDVVVGESEDGRERQKVSESQEFREKLSLQDLSGTTGNEQEHSSSLDSNYRDAVNSLPISSQASALDEGKRRLDDIEDLGAASEPLLVSSMLLLEEEAPEYHSESEMEQKTNVDDDLESHIGAQRRQNSNDKNISADSFETSSITNLHVDEKGEEEDSVPMEEMQEKELEEQVVGEGGGGGESEEEKEEEEEDEKREEVQQEQQEYEDGMEEEAREELAERKETTFGNFEDDTRAGTFGVDESPQRQLGLLNKERKAATIEDGYPAGYTGQANRKESDEQGRLHDGATSERPDDKLVQIVDLDLEKGDLPEVRGRVLEDNEENNNISEGERGFGTHEYSLEDREGQRAVEESLKTFEVGNDVGGNRNDNTAEDDDFVVDEDRADMEVNSIDVEEVAADEKDVQAEFGELVDDAESIIDNPEEAEVSAAQNEDAVIGKRADEGNSKISGIKVDDADEERDNYEQTKEALRNVKPDGDFNQPLLADGQNSTVHIKGKAERSSERDNARLLATPPSRNEAMREEYNASTAEGTKTDVLRATTHVEDADSSLQETSQDEPGPGITSSASLSSDIKCSDIQSIPRGLVDDTMEGQGDLRESVSSSSGASQVCESSDTQRCSGGAAALSHHSVMPSNVGRPIEASRVSVALANLSEPSTPSGIEADRMAQARSNGSVTEDEGFTTATKLYTLESRNSKEAVSRNELSNDEVTVEKSSPAANKNVSENQKVTVPRPFSQKKQIVSESLRPERRNASATRTSDDVERVEKVSIGDKRLFADSEYLPNFKKTTTNNLESGGQARSSEEGASCSTCDRNDVDASQNTRMQTMTGAGTNTKLMIMSNSPGNMATTRGTEFAPAQDSDGMAESSPKFSDSVVETIASGNNSVALGDNSLPRSQSRQPIASKEDVQNHTVVAVVPDRLVSPPASKETAKTAEQNNETRTEVYVRKLEDAPVTEGPSAVTSNIKVGPGNASLHQGSLINQTSVPTASRSHLQKDQIVEVSPNGNFDGERRAERQISRMTNNRTTVEQANFSRAYVQEIFPSGNASAPKDIKVEKRAAQGSGAVESNSIIAGQDPGAVRSDSTTSTGAQQSTQLNSHENRLPHKQHVEQLQNTSFSSASAPGRIKDAMTSSNITAKLLEAGLGVRNRPANTTKT